MKVLIFSAYFLPHQGGVENYIYQIAKHLIKKGASVTILTCRTEKGSSWQEEMEKIKIYRLPCWHILKKTYPIPHLGKNYFKIFKILKKEKFDFINYHTRFYLSSLLGFFYGKKKRMPTILTEHGSCHSSLNNPLVKIINIIYDHTFGWLVTRFSDINLAVSQAAGEFSKHLGAKDYQIVYNGIDLDFWRRENESSLNNIAFVGRLIKAKGVQDLIRVFLKIESKYNTNLLIVGDGPDKARLEKLSANHPKIKFLGEKKREEVREILKTTSILVNPSYSEGLPTVALEAGAAKNLIIATDVGGTKEIIPSQEYGFLFKPGEIDSLEKILIKVLSGYGQFNSLKEKLFKRISKKFNWDKISQKYLEILKNNKKIIKVNIITPLRKGGTWFWGQKLSQQINKTGLFRASHKYKLSQLLISPFWQKAEIVHTSIPISFRLWKKPTILTLHGDYRKEKNIWKHFYPRAIKKADLITTPSHFLKNELNLNQALVIPNAVDLPNNKVDLTEKDKKIFFLTITNFHFRDKSKGVLEIIKNIANLKNDLKIEFEYHILGNGKFLKQTKEAAKKYNLNNIFFEGFKNPKEFYSKADIFLYYSGHDNLPLVIMEAMSYGLPVITNQVGAVAEIIDHRKNGLIAKKENEYYLLLKEAILNNDLRIKIKEAAQNKIKNDFSWQRITPQWVKVYQELWSRN